jgi:Fic family protein
MTTSDDALEILDLLQKAPSWSLQELAISLPQIPHSTLKRRVSELAASKMISVEGKGRATRYRFIPATLGSATTNEEFIPYRFGFLYEYQPNTSYYLDEETRKLLRMIGESIGEAAPAGTYARNLFSRLLIDLSFNSSRLEGNTYSLLETDRLIVQGQIAQDKDSLDAQMILNHKAAIEYLVEGAGEITFDRSTLLNLHALLADSLLADPGAPGRLRTIAVGIHGTSYRPLSVPQQLEEMFDLFLRKSSAIADPFEQAFFAMVHIPYLQPFEDVNKRVSRLAANIPLIRFNLCPLSFVEVETKPYISALIEVYERNNVSFLRSVFVDAYQKSAARYAQVQQTLHKPDPFRLSYRQQLREVVAKVIQSVLHGTAAVQFIKNWSAAHIPPEHSERFLLLCENELLHLHSGNFARYPVRPSEFATWVQAKRQTVPKKIR